jgi:hypothetical protein
MADSEEGLAALLAESCLDGILRTQYRIVVDAQPFWGTHENPYVRYVRVGLVRLLDWRTRLDAGSQVGAWATPVEPTVHVEPPVELQSFEVCAPGELVGERDIARFRLNTYEPGAPASCQAGSYVDLGFEPVDVEDTFERQTEGVLDAVVQLIAMFTELVQEVPGSRRLAMSSEHATAWVEANASSRFWSEQELSGLAPPTSASVWRLVLNTQPRSLGRSAECSNGPSRRPAR